MLVRVFHSSLHQYVKFCDTNFSIPSFSEEADFVEFFSIHLEELKFSCFADDVVARFLCYDNELGI